MTNLSHFPSIRHFVESAVFAQEPGARRSDQFALALAKLLHEFAPDLHLIDRTIIDGGLLLAQAAQTAATKADRELVIATIARAAGDSTLALGSPTTTPLVVH